METQHAGIDFSRAATNRESGPHPVPLAARAEKLLSVTTALSQAATVSDVTSVALGLGLEVVEAARGFIARFDGAEMEMLCARGYGDEALRRVNALRLVHDTPLARCMKTRQPVYLSSVDEYRREYPWAYGQFGAVSASQAHAALPLVHGDMVIGGLGLSFKEPNAFGAADRAFTQLLAQATAGALARAIDFDTERSCRREAELLARAREDVLAVVAHDLRNPLNLVKTTAELLSDTELPAEQRQKLLAASVRAANQMNQMIGDLLDARRIRAGGLSVHPVECDAAVIVAQVEETMRPAATQNGVTLLVTCPPVGTHLIADPARVAQALGNLVANAIKFTPKGGLVSVRARPRRNVVLFEVVDTGPGISLPERAHLFDKFWQARRDTRGLGLGLAIVKAIVTAHGGRVLVSSQPGTGSAFALAFRRAGPGRRELRTEAAGKTL